MPKVIRNIISIPLLLKQGYEKANGKWILHFFSNDFYRSGYIDNNLLILALNKNIFHVERNIDRKSTRLNSSHSGESRMPSSA